jgi:hypothetical protein
MDNPIWEEYCKIFSFIMPDYPGPQLLKKKQHWLWMAIENQCPRSALALLSPFLSNHCLLLPQATSESAHERGAEEKE